MFAIPWHGHTLVGTTDEAIPRAVLEPRTTKNEIEFILQIVGQYLAKNPTRTDVLSVFAGIRPLVKGDGATNTAALSRDHYILNETGLLTVTGGKWTTYRNMAEDGVNRAAAWAGLPPRSCRTRMLRIHGHSKAIAVNDPLGVYGSDAAAIRELQMSERLHAEMPYTAAEVVWAVRHEMARTVEDVLSRRLRALMLNAAAARAMAPRVAALMADELGRNAAWQDAQVRAFTEQARGYELLIEDL